MHSNGSEWRRWDLHIHTPETALNDQFGDWEEYLTAIESQTDVTVLGITDYFSITNYSKLKQYRDEGRISDIDLLIPNIEFRIAPPNDNATAVNIHLLVCPDDPDHEAEIRNALGRLDWRYGGRNYSCLPNQLIALGRAFDPTVADDRAALRVGVTQFKVDFTRLRDWYDDTDGGQQPFLFCVKPNSLPLETLHMYTEDGSLVMPLVGPFEKRFSANFLENAPLRSSEDV